MNSGIYRRWSNGLRTAALLAVAALVLFTAFPACANTPPAADTAVKAEGGTLSAAAGTDGLTLVNGELYSGEEEPEEEEEGTPAGAIIFSGALIVLVIIGFIYSARGKRKR